MAEDRVRIELAVEDLHDEYTQAEQLRPERFVEDSTLVRARALDTGDCHCTSYAAEERVRIELAAHDE